MPQIEVRGLAKTFRVAERLPGLAGAFRGLFHRRMRDVHALGGIDFDIERGELVGYIGPNGAGKSTTIKILAGILNPTAGTCRVDGLTPWRDRRRHVSRIGVVFGQRTQLWWDLPVIESFDLLRDIYRIPPTTYRDNRDRMIALMDLEPLLDVPVRQLSLGQRMRSDLAAALLHGPSLLFLDEPTIGLDAVSKLAIRDFVRELNREAQVTVLLTTHDMDDIEVLCDRVMVIGNGRILVDGSVDGLRRRVRNERVLVVDYDSADAAKSVDAPALDAEGEGVRLVERDGSRVRIAFDPDRLPAATLIGALLAQETPHDLFIEHPPIEQTVAELYAEHDMRER
ncbi:MAG: ABC transporter ATP-binding protein [Gammaproteobacteria bacterium]|nr:ABC transporter ATP-binding protein [Gammaproteobacteria bacterium]